APAPSLRGPSPAEVLPKEPPIGVACGPRREYLRLTLWVQTMTPTAGSTSTSFGDRRSIPHSYVYERLIGRWPSQRGVSTSTPDTSGWHLECGSAVAFTALRIWGQSLLLSRFCTRALLDAADLNRCLLQWAIQKICLRTRDALVGEQDGNDVRYGALIGNTKAH